MKMEFTSLKLAVEERLHQLVPYFVQAGDTTKNKVRMNIHLFNVYLLI